MLAHLTRTAIASSVAALVMVHAAEAATLFDDFDGPGNSDPDTSIWTTYEYDGRSTVTRDASSNLNVNVNTTGYGHYAGAVTHDSTFDAFSAPLVIELDGIAVTGAPGSGNNAGWVVYGRSNLSSLDGTNAREYRANAGSMAYGLAVSVQLRSAGYRLVVTEYADPAGGGVATNQMFDLAGAPSGLKLVIDGANQTVDVTIEGTTFVSTGLTTLTQALSSYFTAANLSIDDTLTSRIALGAINGGFVDAGTLFTIDSIDVGPVPEPASLAVVGAGLLLIARRTRSH